MHVIDLTYDVPLDLAQGSKYSGGASGRHTVQAQRQKQPSVPLMQWACSCAWHHGADCHRLLPLLCFAAGYAVVSAGAACAWGPILPRLSRVAQALEAVARLLVGALLPKGAATVSRSCCT